jgi:glycerol-3-phosphate dehydrogenase (NAD(P)+)
MNIGIIGNGAWGGALATLVSKAGHQPRIGYREGGSGGFPGTPNFAMLSRESDLILVAVPSTSVAEVIEAAQPGAGSMVVLASRGLNPRTGGWLSDLILERTPCRRVGALTGPALASEVVRGRPTALVVASSFDEVCVAAQTALHSEHCRIYSSHDLHGVELAGAMVKILAVALGVVKGIDYGAGAMGVVVTRGIAEASRLGAALGAHPETFSGLAGVGDLVSAATSGDHPSFTAGLSLARGGAVASRTIEQIRAVLALAEVHSIALPLTEAILAIATGEASPTLAFDELMRRSARSE